MASQTASKWQLVVPLAVTALSLSGCAIFRGDAGYERYQRLLQRDVETPKSLPTAVEFETAEPKSVIAVSAGEGTKSAVQLASAQEELPTSDSSSVKQLPQLRLHLDQPLAAESEEPQTKSASNSRTVKERLSEVVGESEPRPVSDHSESVFAKDQAHGDSKEDATDKGQHAAQAGDGDEDRDDNQTPDRLPPPSASRECIDQDPLTLDQVLNSVADSYPLLEVALADLDAADGNALAAWGNFDTVLSAHSTSQPLGFYENYQNGFKASRPLWNGGEVYGGYRIGRGVFEPWYQERQTNEGGEFKSGVKLPLLKGRAIDGRRVEVQTTALERNRLEPDIQTRIIGMRFAASQLYWKWVAAGQAVRTQLHLLELARQRNKSLVAQVKEGDLPKITEIDNGRFIAKRQVKLIESRRKVQEAAIKLSLFYRDDTGQPWVVDDSRLPCEFPTAASVNDEQIETDISAALARRPELVELDFQRQQAAVQLCYARNQTLPKLDAFVETGQDVGEPTSSKRDKSELELRLGVLAEVPLQRRAACGKIRAWNAKIAQIDAKQRFVVDKIRSQVQNAVSALNNAAQRIEQAKRNLELTEQSLGLGRLRFEEGDIDIIQLNIYETSLADAEFLLIEAEFAYFTALAGYQAALALD